MRGRQTDGRLDGRTYAHSALLHSTHRPLDVAPEPVVEHVGDVEALLLRLDRLLAHEPQAAGDDLQRRRRREDLPLHAVGERRHLRTEGSIF